MRPLSGSSQRRLRVKSGRSARPSVRIKKKARAEPNRLQPRLGLMETATLRNPREAAYALLAARGAEATVCPSEVARAIATARYGSDTDWRSRMPEVHAAVDAMLAESSVWLSWKGQKLAVRTGPYRLHRG